MGKKAIRIELDEELHAKAKLKATATGKTMTDVCREALREWVKQDPVVLIKQGESK